MRTLTHPLRRLAPAAALLLATGCSDALLPAGAPPSGGPAPARWNPLGMVEITITGVGSDRPAATARVPGPGGGGATLSLGAPTGSGTSGDGSIQLQQLSTGSFTAGTRGAGGVRYLYTTFRVRNATSAGTPYPTPRTNLTFVAVATARTLQGTAISALRRYDGTAAAPDIALEVKPTGAVEEDARGGVRPRFPDVLQAFAEAEVATVPVASGAYTLPYGFVVSHRDGSRTLPASPAADAWDGVVTFAFKLPLQATPAADPFTVSFTFVAVDDAETRVTRSLEEEGMDGDAAARQRAQTLGATLVTLGAGGTGDRAFCALRTAGPNGAPTATLLSATPTFRGLAPDPAAGAVLPTSGVRLQANFACMQERAPTHATFAVSSALGGRHFVAGGYGFTGQSLLAPQASFFPGDEVEVSLTSALGSGLPRVARYRVASAAANGPLYPQATGVAVGLAPRDGVVADFNLDGHLDVATASYDARSVSVLLGDGRGGLQPAPGSPVPVAEGALRMAMGDMNRDGRPDLVLALAGGGARYGVRVLLGDGRGGFTPGNTVSGFDAYDVAVGDVNRDGAMDVVAVGYLAGSYQLLRIRGHETAGLQPAEPLRAIRGSASYGILLRDVDANGRLDLVWESRGFIGGEDYVGVLLGDAVGGFPTLSDSIAGRYRPRPVEVNGDGRIDLLLTATNGSVELAAGNGNGSFAAPVVVAPAPGTSMTTYALGDADVNGRADVVLLAVTANLGHQTTVYRSWLGVGAGGFSPVGAAHTPLGGLGLPTMAEVADMDEDGRPDLVLASTSRSEVVVLPGQGGAVFRVPFASYGGVIEPRGVAFGDLNRDGSIDMVAHGGGRLHAFLNVEADRLRTGPVRALDGGAMHLLLRDLTSDGRLDAVALLCTGANAEQCWVRIHPGDGAGGFGTPAAAAGPTSGAGRLAVGDLDGDGRLDVVVTSPNDGMVRVWLGDGAGGLSGGTWEGDHPGVPADVALADVDRDGRLDLLTARDGGTLRVDLGTGSGGFRGIEHGVGTLLPGVRSLAVGDLNRDGRADVVACSGQATQMSVLLGDGTGAFSATTRAIGEYPLRCRLADMNGDGRLDVVMTSTLNRVRVFAGDGSGGFANGIEGGATGVNPVDFDVADVSRDGRLDVGVANFTNGSVTLLLNQ